MSHTTCLHPASKAARSACRKAKANREALIPMINAAYDALYVAAVAEGANYDHAEFERCDRVVKGLLIAFAEGDTHYAAGLRNLWSDSNEPIEWYLSTISRDETILRWSGTLTRDEYNALYTKLYIED